MLTQKEIGEHIDLDQSSVSRLCEELAIDWSSAGLDVVRVAYIRRLREQAAGRAASGDLDLATERARLAKEQADRIALQNQVTREELAPAHLIEEVLSKAAGRIAGIFDAIPGMIKRRLPSLSSAEIEMIGAEIARGRNIVANMSLSDLDEAEGDSDAEPIAEVME